MKINYVTRYASPIGELTITGDDAVIRGVWFENQRCFENATKIDLETRNNARPFLETKAWLNDYFAGGRPEIGGLPLFPEGSDFQEEVWKLLLEIPYGEVTTYGALAEKIAEKRGIPQMSAQAVGGAVGHNPISIIIPCHRVIGADGSMTGYGGGVDKKIKLLELEGAEIRNNKWIRREYHAEQ